MAEGGTAFGNRQASHTITLDAVCKPCEDWGEREIAWTRSFFAALGGDSADDDGFDPVIAEHKIEVRSHKPIRPALMKDDILALGFHLIDDFSSLGVFFFL